MEKILEGIAKELKVPVKSNVINGQQVKIVGNTIIGYKMLDPNGGITYETDSTKFPKTCNRKYIRDCIEACENDLGTIKTLNWQFLNDDTFSVIDIETTGFSPNAGGRIIEIGAVKIDNEGNILDKFSRFVNPGMKISQKITDLTQITNDMVKNEDYIGNVMIDFWNFIRGTTVVFHNANFDWDWFLLYELKRIGLELPMNYPCIDTLDLDKYHFPTESQHKLNLMCERLGIEVVNHHRAIYDAEMTAKAFIELRKMSEDKFNKLPKTVWNLGKRSELNIEITSVRFWGKFKRDNSMKVGRQYVTFKCNGQAGSAYYEILENAWYMKSTKIPFLVKNIEEKVLEFTKCKDLEEFKTYGR